VFTELTEPQGAMNLKRTAKSLLRSMSSHGLNALGDLKTCDYLREPFTAIT
jgi:hypothetical protein